jgi:hypothetical protein
MKLPALTASRIETMRSCGRRQIAKGLHIERINEASRCYQFADKRLIDKHFIIRLMALPATHRASTSVRIDAVNRRHSSIGNSVH